MLPGAERLLPVDASWGGSMFSFLARLVDLWLAAEDELCGTLKSKGEL